MALGHSSTSTPARCSRSAGALGGRRGEEPDPRRDGAAAPHPQRGGALPRAPRAVPRGHPAHRLRGGHRRPLPLRHHAPRPERLDAERPARHRGARLRRGPLRARGPRRDLGGRRRTSMRPHRTLPMPAPDAELRRDRRVRQRALLRRARPVRAVERAAHGRRHRRRRRRQAAGRACRRSRRASSRRCAASGPAT